MKLRRVFVTLNVELFCLAIKYVLGKLTSISELFLITKFKLIEVSTSSKGTKETVAEISIGLEYTSIWKSI